MNKIAKLVSALLVACLLSTAALVGGVAVTGCTATQWANFVTVSTQFSTYVLAALQAAEALWTTLVLPQLGPNAATANAIFNDAVVSVTNALAVLQDGVQTAQNAQQSSLDITALMQNVKDAFAHVMAIINQFKTGEPAPSGLGMRFDSLDAHAHTIAVWH